MLRDPHDRLASALSWTFKGVDGRSDDMLMDDTEGVENPRCFSYVGSAQLASDAAALERVAQRDLRGRPLVRLRDRLHRRVGVELADELALDPGPVADAREKAAARRLAPPRSPSSAGASAV